MNLQSDFIRLLQREMAVSRRRMLARWEVTYANTARWVSEGKLPAASVLLGSDTVEALDFLQSFRLLAFRYQDQAELLIHTPADRAVFEVILLEKDKV